MRLCRDLTGLRLGCRTDSEVAVCTGPVASGFDNAAAIAAFAAIGNPEADMLLDEGLLAKPFPQSLLCCRVS